MTYYFKSVSWIRGYVKCFFFRLVRITLVRLGLISRNRKDLAVDLNFWGKFVCDCKNLDLSRHIDAKKWFSSSEMSWFASYSLSLHIRDIIELLFLGWIGFRNLLKYFKVFFMSFWTLVDKFLVNKF